MCLKLRHRLNKFKIYIIRLDIWIVIVIKYSLPTPKIRLHVLVFLLPLRFPVDALKEVPRALSIWVEHMEEATSVCEKENRKNKKKWSHI